MFRRKHWEIYNVYSSNENRSYKNDKNGEEIAENMSYITQFIDSARFMAGSLSNPFQ